jgi:hypothetical protein
LINLLREENNIIWRDLLASLANSYSMNGKSEISKNMVNAVLLLAREAEIIKTQKGKSLSTAPVLLSGNGERSFQDAIIRSDSAYLQAILKLPEPFDLKEAALALYDDEKFIPYLRRLLHAVDPSLVG